MIYFSAFSGVPLSQHLASSIPAWSLSKRNPPEVFTEWIFDARTQCKFGNADDSVCREVKANETSCKYAYVQNNSTKKVCSEPAVGQTVAMNVWLGGDFNPFEGCDTSSSGDTVDGEKAIELVDVSCNPTICDPKEGFKEAYYRRMPNLEKCYSKIKNLVERVNVPRSSENNLCSKKPMQHSAVGGVECLLEQGQAKMGLVGKPAENLYAKAEPIYASSELSSTGQGLFVKGGNPIYFTSKGTEEEIAVNQPTTLPDLLGITCFAWHNLFFFEQSHLICMVCSKTSTGSSARAHWTLAGTTLFSRQPSTLSRARSS